jgi:hypothetical protein
MLSQRETPALYHEILDLVDVKLAKAEPKKPKARRAYKPGANGKSLLDAVLEKSEKSYKAADRDLKALGNEKIDWMNLKEERRIAATHAYKALSPEKAKELGVYLCLCGAIVGRTHPRHLWNPILFARVRSARNRR